MVNRKFSFSVVLLILVITLGGRARGQINETQLRDKLTASTVVVEVTSPNGRKDIGTGWVISSQNKQIITACHGVEKAVSINVMFPKRNATGWAIGDPEVQNSPRNRAEIVHTKTEVDLAILRVPTMPKDIPQLSLAKSPPSSGSSTYLVGHLGEERKFFQFLPGKIDAIGFAVSVAEPGGQSFSFWSDVIAYSAEGLRPGTSGSALVNSAGEVIGVAFGLLIHDEAMCMAISVRELKELIGESNLSPTPEPRSIVGRWIGRLPNSNVECGFEFRPDKSFSLMTPQIRFEGKYRVTKSSIFLKCNGKSEQCKVEWLGDDSFTINSLDLVFTCERYDAGWKQN